LNKDAFLTVTATGRESEALERPPDPDQMFSGSSATSPTGRCFQWSNSF